MSRHGIYDEKFGFIPDDDCPPDYNSGFCYGDEDCDACWEQWRREQLLTKKRTNADRIRAKTDEELAGVLNALLAWHAKKLLEQLHEQGITDVHYVELKQDCIANLLDWLKQEAEDD